MILSMVQLSLEAGSVARNMQRLLGVLAQAVSTATPPDLVVLPGSCDLASLGRGRGGGDAIAQLEAICLFARDYGCPVVCGFDRPGIMGGGTRAVYIDADGDVVAAASGGRPCVVGTMLGELSLAVTADDWLDAADLRGPAFLPLSLAEPFPTPDMVSRLAKAAVERRAGVVVVRASDEGGHGRALALTANGESIPAVEADELVITATVTHDADPSNAGAISQTDRDGLIGAEGL